MRQEEEDKLLSSVKSIVLVYLSLPYINTNKIPTFLYQFLSKLNFSHTYHLCIFKIIQDLGYANNLFSSNKKHHEITIMQLKKTDIVFKQPLRCGSVGSNKLPFTNLIIAFATYVLKNFGRVKKFVIFYINFFYFYHRFILIYNFYI